MKRVLHIIILMALGVAMSKCKCGQEKTYLASYKIGILNKSNAKITKFEYHFKSYEYTTAVLPPTTDKRIGIPLVDQDDNEIFSFKIQFDNSIIIENIIPLEPLPNIDRLIVNVDIIVEPDFTLTIKQYEIANSNTDERRLIF